MRVPYVYLTTQFADPARYLKKIAAVAKRGDFTLGREVGEFEEKAARMLGVQHVVGVGSGTDAIYLTLKAIGIQAGDEVITAPNSFVATAAAIALAGARPVFVDVRDDYTIDPSRIEQAITGRTKAIIPVHLTGQPADMDTILALANRHQLLVLEDCAQAFLASYRGASVGTLGRAGAFSFHPLKVLHVWGDGGMVATNDADLARAVRLWRNHGLRSRNEVMFFAHNSRLDTIHAAVACALLPKVPAMVRKRQAIARLYDKLLAPLADAIRIPPRDPATSHAFTNYVVMAQNRDALIAFLSQRGIEAVVQYPTPIHLQPAAAYLGYRKGDFPVCERQADEIVTLPCNQHMSARDVRYVCSAIRMFYERRR